MASKLRWCACQKKGLKLIEPNDNLFEEYISTAEETLDVLDEIKGKSNIWVATTKYYCEYFALYSILMKIGIKCEIHDCTIEVCKIIEVLGIIPKGYSKILEQDKELRIDNQYYLKNKEVFLDYPSIVEFVFTIKNIGNKLTKDKIDLVRKFINQSI